MRGGVGEGVRGGEERGEGGMCSERWGGERVRGEEERG